MADRTLQLVVQYDGAGFSGWQRQPAQRTVQGVIEEALARLCGAPVSALGSGRTDAGVHARGQAVGVIVPAKWESAQLRRAMNAVLPSDVWVARAIEMRPEFHARYSATARRYGYHVGTDDDANSPFRRRFELGFPRAIDRATLEQAARAVVGDHCFRAFAVQGTAPGTDDHRCIVTTSHWSDRPGGLLYTVQANRFLHHMVRFLVGTMLDIATGRRPATDMATLLAAKDNRDVSPPVPPHALFLEAVEYPAELYLVS
jgi:tRNA pseudouridine38-40 synthase